LACALSYSDGNVLRLFAVPKDNPDAPVTETSDYDFPVCSRGFRGGRRGRGGRFHGGHGGRFHGDLGGRCPGGPGGWGSEMFKAKLISKCDFFRAQLEELEKVPEKTPEQQQEILRLQKKIEKN